MSRIVIVEDNTSIAEGIATNLQMEGHDVRIATTARAALDVCRAFGPQVVLLDVMLPDGVGTTVLERLRAEGFDAPVLILSALGGEADKLRGFRAGADDYVTKPFGLLELLARVDALLRRSRIATASPGTATTIAGIQIAEAVVNVQERTVTRWGDQILFRPKEWDLLLGILRHENTVVPRTTLLREVWGYDTSVQSRTIDTHMVELRRKLGDDVERPRFVHTVRKLGYRLSLSPSTETDVVGAGRDDSVR